MSPYQTRIDTTLIQTSGRIRNEDGAQVAALAESIKEVGLLNPITVYRCKVIRAGRELDGFGLIAGMHRLRAVQSLSGSEIEATILDLDEHQRIIAECDENLVGSKLTPSQVADFTAKRKAAYLALHPDTAHGKASSNKEEKFSSFDRDQASKTGVSDRKVRMDAARGENITPTALALVHGTKLDKGTFLDMLAKVPAEKQIAVVKRHLAQGKPGQSRGASTPREKPVVKSDAEVVADEIADTVHRWNKWSPEDRALFLAAVGLPAMDRREP